MKIPEQFNTIGWRIIVLLFAIISGLIITSCSQNKFATTERQELLRKNAGPFCRQWMDQFYVTEKIKGFVVNFNPSPNVWNEIDTILVNENFKLEMSKGLYVDDEYIEKYCNPERYLDDGQSRYKGFTTQKDIIYKEAINGRLCVKPKGEIACLDGYVISTRIDTIGIGFMYKYLVEIKTKDKAEMIAVDTTVLELIPETYLGQTK